MWYGILKASVLLIFGNSCIGRGTVSVCTEFHICPYRRDYLFPFIALHIPEIEFFSRWQSLTLESAQYSTRAKYLSRYILFSLFLNKTLNRPRRWEVSDRQPNVALTKNNRVASLILAGARLYTSTPKIGPTNLFVHIHTDKKPTCRLSSDLHFALVCTDWH
jgi:hypothetical protein